MPKPYPLMSDKSDLPPPVTKKSSKADLWEALETCRDEIDRQQDTINELKVQNACSEMRQRSLENELEALRHRVEIARMALK